MTFIYIFLPLVCALYFLVGPKFRNFILLVSSLVFYAWGEPTYVYIMLAVILVNYFGGLLKFSSNLKPKINPKPIAISEYPLKS